MYIYVYSSEKPVENVAIISAEIKKIQLSLEEKLQLEEQIRKFVQLVTQNYLLSFGESELNFINESSKQILKELSDVALENNLLNAHNLKGALDIIKEFEENAYVLSKSKCQRAMSHRVKKTIFNSEVFMYPELLPTCGFIWKRKWRRQHQKVTFFKAEDYLIALGLERFSNDCSPVHKIQTHILPFKTVEQIRVRIKNLKASKAYKDNPIKYYYAHKKAPPFPRNVQIFDPNKVRAPKDLSPSNDLPAWMIPLFRKGNCRSNIVKKIIPKPRVIVYKPRYILPKSVTIQNGNILHSFIQKEKKIPKPTYSPSFILPKGKKRINKQLNLNVANQSNLESDTNSATKYTSKQDKLLDIADKNNDETVNKDIIKTQFIIDKLNIKSNECINAEVGFKNNEVSNKGMTEPLVGHDYKCTHNITTKNVKDIVKPSVTTGDNSEKKKNIEKNSSIGKVVTKPLVVTDSTSSKLKKLPLLAKVIIKPLFVVDDKNRENKQFNSCSLINLNDNECHEVLETEHSNDESNTVSIERNYSKKEKISKTVDFYPDPNGKECGVIIKSEIIDESYESVDEACNIEFPTPGISDSSFCSVNKSNIIQTPHRYFEECKSEPRNSICVNQKLHDFENKRITFIEDSFRKDANITEENKCESDTVPNILKKILKFPVERKDSNDIYSQQLSKYVYEANSNECDNELCVASSSDKLIQDADVSTCSNENKIEIANAFCESSENINNILLMTNGKVIKSVEFIGDSNVKDCDFVIKSGVMRENSNSLQNTCLKDCETVEMTQGFVENKTETNGAVGLSYISKHENLQNVYHIKQEKDFDIVQTPESAHINIDKQDICIELATNYNNKQDVDNIKCKLNNKQLTKTIDFFPDSSDKICGIVIKSEIIEESHDSLEDTCKVDFNLENGLHVNSSSAMKSYNTRLRKRNLKTVDQSSITKKRKILHNSIETAVKFTKSAQCEQLHNSYLTQNIESNDSITAYSEKVPIKSEIVYDCETHLKNANDVIFSKPVLRTRKSVIKSNSLEKAHLKRYKRTTSQKRRKQNYQLKKKVRKKH